MTCIYNRDGKCKILEVEECIEPQKCRFCKSSEHEEIERNACFSRLSKLPAKKQKHIADTYYRGKKVWEG